MTREEKIKVLAELDGWQFYGIERTQILWTLKNPQGETVASDEDPGATFAGFAHLVPNYLTRYDAIIPLVKKRCVGNALLEQTFINEIERGVCSGFHAARTVGFFPMAAEPEQLADALIKAVGKWRE